MTLKKTPAGTERHVQFVQTLDIEDEDRYGGKIDDFLYDIFQRRSPLKFSSLERATRNSQAVVLVRCLDSSTFDVLASNEFSG